MNVGFPFSLDGRGGVASPGGSAHIRQLIEQLLFTAPGERVNRPDFGCGLLSAVFSAKSQPELVATQFLVHQALTKWLGSLIETRSVRVAQDRDVLTVTVSYLERKNRRQEEATFEVSRG